MCWREPAALAGWQRTAGHMCSCSHPAIKGGGSNAAGASGGCKRYNDVLKYIYIYTPEVGKKRRKKGLQHVLFGVSRALKPAAGCYLEVGGKKSVLKVGFIAYICASIFAKIWIKVDKPDFHLLILFGRCLEVEVQLAWPRRHSRRALRTRSGTR